MPELQKHIRQMNISINSLAKKCDMTYSLAWQFVSKNKKIAPDFHWRLLAAAEVFIHKQKTASEKFLALEKPHHKPVLRDCVAWIDACGEKSEAWRTRHEFKLNEWYNTSRAIGVSDAFVGEINALCAQKIILAAQFESDLDDMQAAVFKPSFDIISEWQSLDEPNFKQMQKVIKDLYLPIQKTIDEIGGIYYNKIYFYGDQPIGTETHQAINKILMRHATKMTETLKEGRAR